MCSSWLQSYLYCTTKPDSKILSTSSYHSVFVFKVRICSPTGSERQLRWDTMGEGWVLKEPDKVGARQGDKTELYMLRKSALYLMLCHLGTTVSRKNINTKLAHIIIILLFFNFFFMTSASLPLAIHGINWLTGCRIYVSHQKRDCM